MKRRSDLLASAAIGARQAGRVAAPDTTIAIFAVFAADASCTVMLGEAAFALPEQGAAFRAALEAMPGKDAPVVLTVRGSAASARHVGAILQLIRAAGFDHVTVVKGDEPAAA